MDIKLSIDGGFEMTNGDFATADGLDTIVLDINKIIRTWVGNYNIMKYAGMNNTRETAQLIKRELDSELQKYIMGITVEVKPASIDSIFILIGFYNTQKPIYKMIFTYTNGILKYMEINDLYLYYRDNTNIYL